MVLYQGQNVILTHHNRHEIRMQLDVELESCYSNKQIIIERADYGKPCGLQCGLKV